jgi:superfamily II RNA helicase
VGGRERCGAGAHADQVKLLRRKRMPRVTEVTEQLREYALFPAIWFIFSRKQCDQAVDFLAGHTLTSDVERAAIQLEVDRLRASHPEVSASLHP